MLDAAVSSAVGDSSPGRLRNMSRILWRHKPSVFGGALLIFIVFGALLAPSITPYEPDKTAVLNRLESPSRAHWMGTDELGRDVFTRLMYGGRISLLVGVASIGVTLIVGILIGALAGFRGGVLDSLLMRFTDVMISFPQIFVLILLVSFLGQNLQTIVIVLGLISWMPMARLVRAEMLSLKEKEFILAARSIGVTGLGIVLRHLLPNAVGPIIVAATLGVGAAIRSESGLSYLGLGLQPPTASWGTMLQNAQAQFMTAPWTAIFPGLMIFLTVISINFLGDGLRDAMDPRTGSGPR